MILTIALNFGKEEEGDAEIMAAGIFVAIVLTYRITGSHFNASISLGVYALQGQYAAHVKILFTYIGAQLVGSYFGMLFCWGVLGHEDSLDLHPLKDDHEVGFVFLTEMLFSALFMTIYLHTKTDKLAPSANPGLRAITMGII